MQQTVYSFEHGSAEGFSSSPAGTFGLSRAHARDGEMSLYWDFAPGSSLRLDAPIGYRPFEEGSADKARQTFVCYLYREEAAPASFRFAFAAGGEEACSFEIRADFTGWRAIWVQYDRDMEGTPREGLDRLTISALSGSGRLFIDQLIPAVPIDPRHPTRDRQQPFVNLQADRAANAHWLSLYRFEELERLSLAAGRPVPATAGERGAEKLSAAETALRLDRFYMESGAGKASKTLEELRTLFAEYEIRETPSGLRGRTVDGEAHRACWPKPEASRLFELTRPIDVKKAAALLLDLALYCRRGLPLAEEASAMFCLLCRHLLDQGFAAGSALGTAHHLGYPLRDYFAALFLMRDRLKEAGLLGLQADALAWYTGRGRVFRPDAEMRWESMDTLNTFAPGMLASAVMEENPERKALILRHYKNWLDHCLLPAPGLMGPFKIDGTAFHHCGQYPAYAMGGFQGIAPVLYALSGGVFAVSREAHENVRRALLTMRFYTNLLDWPLAMAARHPLGRGVHAHISSTAPFRYLALAGSPDGEDEIDREPAEAYLRLTEPELKGEPEAEQRCRALRGKGFLPEPPPTGHMALNYAGVSLHRRDNWLASVRGHSRYLWANETYVNANLYGRYITYGHLELLHKGEPVTQLASGYQPEGFDFSAFPGTTTIALPPAELLEDVRNVDQFSGFEEMLLSDNTFCGGLTDGENGMFGFELHEHPKYDGSHRARKSWFFADEEILCVGTAIENTDEAHETITTLFQHLMADGDSVITLDGSPVPDTLELPAEPGAAEPWVLTDNKDNVYLIEKSCGLRVTRGLQHSFMPTDGSPTEGRFAKAVLLHGRAPKASLYRYKLIVNGAGKALPEERFTLLRADRRAHIVRDEKTRTTWYSLFDPLRPGEDSLIQSTDKACLLAAAETEGGCRLLLCDPDLRLYRGIDPEQYDASGLRVEVSLYSRPWRSNPSEPQELIVTFGEGFRHGERRRAEILMSDGLKKEIFVRRLDS